VTSDMFPETVKPVPPGETPSWFTDRGWFLAKESDLRARGFLFGPTTLDVFAHARAPVSREIRRRGGRFWTLADDAFQQHVRAHEVVFANPPYDAETMERALSLLWRFWRMAPLGGMWALIPSLTDRAWWHEHIEPYRLSGELYVEFVKGRLAFGWPDNPEGVGADGAKFPSAVLAWRK
jgi:hypothetical protein